MLKTKSHRITERFKLEETSGSYLVQSSCSSRDKAMIFLQISISDTQKGLCGLSEKMQHAKWYKNQKRRCSKFSAMHQVIQP